MKGLIFGILTIFTLNAYSFDFFTKDSLPSEYFFEFIYKAGIKAGFDTAYESKVNYDFSLFEGIDYTEKENINALKTTRMSSLRFINENGEHVNCINVVSPSLLEIQYALKELGLGKISLATIEENSYRDEVYNLKDVKVYIDNVRKFYNTTVCRVVD